MESGRAMGVQWSNLYLPKKNPSR